MRAHRRPIAGPVLGGLLALALIAGVSAAAAANATSRAARSVSISASLSETPFAPNETDSVHLLARFSAKSSSFSYRLSIKKRSYWQLVRSRTLRGSFKGSRSMPFAKLKKAVVIGHYRLELNAGGRSTTLYFDVVKALKTATVTLGAADSHSCALVADGRVKCWGGNHYGELGNRSTTDSVTPVTASGISNARALTTGGFMTCALLPGGKVKCWGDNSHGKLGAGPGFPSASSIPIAVNRLAHAVAVSSGADHSCALLAGGTVRCWGRNDSGDIGGSKSFSTVPLNVPGITGATAISAGYRHSCALLANGKVACWGNNHFGQLGNGKTGSSKKPVTVNGLTKAVAVSAGNDQSCAVLSNHTVKCWGRADGGSLGDGASSHDHKDKGGIDFKPTPVTVKSVSNAGSVSVGSGFGCARLSNNQIKCWGENSSGQLGNGSTADSLTPVVVSGISAATAISASSKSHACALVSGGKVKCWGRNDLGQLGGGAQNFSATPVAAAVTGAAAVAAGDAHNCALLSDGTVKCWGDNSAGQLGNGTTATSASPVSVGGVTGASVVAAGSSHSCAVASAVTYCWGGNSDGQLGDGTTVSSSNPVAVVGLSVTAKGIAAGSKHSCALLTDGTVQCWGGNSDGQLGNGSTTGSPAPVAVGGLTTTAKAISTGAAHSCALLTDGTVQCWGDNSTGQLGNGSTTDSSSAAPVSGVAGAKAIAAGYDHSCALLSDGTVKCWGDNAKGELGNGSATASSTAVTVSGISGALSISAGSSSSCAVLADGKAKCWGDNTKGKLGNGSTTNSSSAVTVSEIAGAEAITAGASHSCALLTSGGAVRCWGDNTAGELGVGVLDYSSTPVEVIALP